MRSGARILRADHIARFALRNAAKRFGMSANYLTSSVIRGKSGGPHDEVFLSQQFLFVHGCWNYCDFRMEAHMPTKQLCIPSQATLIHPKPIEIAMKWPS